MSDASTRRLRALLAQWEGMCAHAWEEGPIPGDEIGHASRWEAVEICKRELAAVLDTEVDRVFDKLAASQVDLPADAAKVLNENLWNLYERADTDGDRQTLQHDLTRTEATLQYKPRKL